MRIVVDINDAMITRWGSVELHNVSYEPKELLVIVPGFEYKTAETEEDAPIKINILKDDIEVPVLLKKQDVPDEYVSSQIDIEPKTDA